MVPTETLNRGEHHLPYFGLSGSRGRKCKEMDRLSFFFFFREGAGEGQRRGEKERERERENERESQAGSVLALNS